MTVDQFNKVIELIKDGKSLRKSCVELGYSRSSFDLLVNNDETLMSQYTRAREERADKIFEEILDIADDGTNDFMTIVKGDKEYNVEDKEVTNRSRLRIDARKWMLGKMQPKKYGDKIDVTSDGEKVSSTAIVVNIVPPNTDE